MADAADLLCTLAPTSCTSSSNASGLLDEMRHRTTLTKHLLLLDGAIDRCTSERLLSLREEGRFAGVALVSDESPPSQPRLRGLSFQITVFYWGTFKDLSQWETCEDPPIQVITSVADITHCPGKKGVDVSRIIEKQLPMLGLNCFDVTTGTRDGGGGMNVTKVCMPTSSTSILTMFVGDASHTFPGEPVMWPFESLLSTIEPWQPTYPKASLGIA